ncbi:MAG: hypothetical protein ACYDCO_06710 [Armatimonadota bacterium]
MLGMYIHTHWGYHHPYAARTWTIRDWEAYLQGLHGLGFDLITIWPLLDSMPVTPNLTDRIFLRTLAQAIDLAHSRFGMKVALVAGANAIGNKQAADYVFSKRPYFACEHRVNPKDVEETQAFFAGRHHQLSFLPHADALAIIDSDPGGYPGSSVDELVMLMEGQAAALRSHNPRAEFIYWMWLGWEYINDFHARTAAGEAVPMAFQENAEEFMPALSAIQERLPEPWWLLHCLPQHDRAIDAFGLRDKAMWFPYGLLEGEPTFPLINCDPTRLGQEVTADRLNRCHRGAMGNLQNHCLQLPHTYIFSHLATGGSPETPDLPKFADELLPGTGDTIAEAWLALESRDADRQWAAIDVLMPLVGQLHRTGRLAGLLFHDPDRFLVDLAMNLGVRAALVELNASPVTPALVKKTLDTVRAYQQRLGFVDTCFGPLADGLFPPLAALGDPGIDEALAQFNTWQDPSLRHGALQRVLEAVETYCRSADSQALT